MSSVTGLTGTNSSFGNYSVGTPSSVNFSGSIFVSKPEETEEETSQKQAQIAALQQQKAELQSRKTELEAELRELNAQKNQLTQQKQKLEAEIRANEAKIQEYSQKIAEYSQQLNEEKQELQQLEKQYQEKNEKISQLDEQLQAKIAEVLEQSKLNIDNQQKKVEDARKEAEEKVASGELKEEEVAQYILNKVGGIDVQSNASDLELINSLCSQIKANISDSQQLLSQIGEKETSINKYTALIASGDIEVKRLQDINAGKRDELSVVNDNISLVNGEISNVNNEISNINSQITAIDSEINAIQSGTGSKVYIPSFPSSHGTGSSSSKAPRHTASTGTTATTGSTTYANPFADVTYDNVEYSSVIEALDMSSKTTDMLLQTVRTQISNDNEKIRNIFATVA